MYTEARSGERITWFLESAFMSEAISRQTRFWSQPVKFTGCGFAEVFRIVYRRMVAGVADSRAFIGMNGEKISALTEIGKGLLLVAYSILATGYSPTKEILSKSFLLSRLVCFPTVITNPWSI